MQAITCKKFSRPFGVAVDKNDNIYVSDWGNSSLFKFSKEGKLMKVVGKEGTRPEEFSDLSFIKVINGKLYVCDHGNNRVQILNTELESVNSFACQGGPNDIAQDGAGNVYVIGGCVQVFDYNGQFLSTFSEKGAASKQLDSPHGICIGSDQLVYVCEWKNDCVSVFKISGEFVTFGQFRNPVGIVINDGFVYVVNNVSSGKIHIF